MLTAVLTSALLLLAGCGGLGEGSDEGSDEASAASAGASADEQAAGSEPGAARQAGAAQVSPLQRAVVSTGSLRLRTDDIARARAETLRLVAGWGGIVADEQSVGDDRGGLVGSNLTLRVPSTRFDTAMSGLADLGTVLDQSRAAEDVTTQVVDNDARVRAQERSVRRVEALLSEAERLADVIAIESDLARRQADLDSLRSQQAYLADQTSLSTITVGLESGAPVAADDGDGFLAGLASGWDALSTSTVVLVTALGAAVPFVALLALIATPIWLMVRRRRSAPRRDPAAAGSPA